MAKTENSATDRKTTREDFIYRRPEPIEEPEQVETLSFAGTAEEGAVYEELSATLAEAARSKLGADSATDRKTTREDFIYRRPEPVEEPEQEQIQPLAATADEVPVDSPVREETDSALNVILEEIRRANQNNYALTTQLESVQKKEEELEREIKDLKEVSATSFRYLFDEFSKSNKRKGSQAAQIENADEIIESIGKKVEEASEGIKTRINWRTASAPNTATVFSFFLFALGFFFLILGLAEGFYSRGLAIWSFVMTGFALLFNVISIIYSLNNDAVEALFSVVQIIFNGVMVVLPVVSYLLDAGVSI